MKTRLSLFVLLLSFISSQTLQAQQLVSYEGKGTLPFIFYTFLVGSEAKYDVETYKITYTTTDLMGAVDTASGLVALPVTDDFTPPLALVQHGTVSGPDDVPSNLAGGFELGAILTSAGYISIQPDYLGLGESDGLHPYVHADSEASAGIDMIFATQELLGELGTQSNGQLFVTGYSQGGHAAMAAHRSLELDYADVLPVTAAAPMSGPYSISEATRERLLSDSTYNYPAYAAWTLMSYNEAYGLYDSLVQYMKQPYADMALSFKNEEIDLADLQVLMIDQLTMDHGGPIVKFMFHDSLITAISTDENHPFNHALRDNDTYDWAPMAPTRLFYCMNDDQVAFTNSVLADSVMNANGAADLQAIDVDPTQDHTGCILPAGMATLNFFKIYADFSLITSTNKLSELEGLSLFPNPASSQVRINGLPENATIQVIDMQGRILQNRALTQGSESISVEAFVPGMYLFRVTAPEGVWNQQVMVR